MRRMLFALFLALGGFLVTCHPTSQSVHVKLASNINCTHGNGTLCAISQILRRQKSNSRSRELQSSRKLEIIGSDNEVVKEIEEVTGRRKKNKGHHGMLIYLIAAAKATMLYSMIHGVAIIAGKALVVAKIALAIGIAILLTKSEHHDKVSYEIIKHPHHSYVQTHSSSVDYDHHSDFGESSYGHRRRRMIFR